MRLVLLFLSWTVLCAAAIQSSLPYDWYSNAISSGQYSDGYTDYSDIYDLPGGYGSYNEQTGQYDDYDYPYSADTSAYEYEPGLEQSTLGTSPYESASSYDLASMYQPSGQEYTDYEPMSIYNVPYEDSLNDDDYLSYPDYQDTEYQPYHTYDDLYDQEATELSESVSKYHTPDYYAAYDTYMGSPDAYYDSYGPIENDHPAENKYYPSWVGDEKYKFDDDIFSHPLPKYAGRDHTDYGFNADNYFPIDQRGEPDFYRHNDHGYHTLHDQLPRLENDELKNDDNFAAPAKPREPVAKKFDRYGKDQSSLAYVPNKNRRYTYRFPPTLEGHNTPDFGNAHIHRGMKAWPSPKSGVMDDYVSDYKTDHHETVVNTSPEKYGHLGRDQTWSTYDKYASAESNLNNEPAHDWYPSEAEKHKMSTQHDYEPQHYNEDDDKAYKMKSEYDDFTYMKRKKTPNKKSFTDKEAYTNYMPDWQKLYEDDDDDDNKKGKIYGQSEEGDSENELLHDVNYRLKSGITGEGKFIGYGAQEKGTKYHEVTAFHHGGSIDKSGKHKTRYGGYDTYGTVKQYGEENAKRRHMIEGSLKAQGGSDGYENGYIRGKLSRKNRQETDEDESDNIKVKGSSGTRPLRRRSRRSRRRSHKKRHGYKNTQEDRYKQY